MLVTTSKYTMALMAMRATLPRSRTLAMPWVTVQKMINPTTIWISRMKMSPSGLRVLPMSGTSAPTITPSTMPVTTWKVRSW